MHVRLTGNLWRSGKAYHAGDILDVEYCEAERLALIGVAEVVEDGDISKEHKQKKQAKPKVKQR